MSCRTHLVDCLRKMNIEPLAFSDGYHRDLSPNNVIADEISVYKYFHSKYDKGDQYWGIDFKRNVVIKSYKLFAGQGCNMVTNWTVSVSNDNKTYFLVDKRKGIFPNGETYKLGIKAHARYLKLNGNTPGCVDFPNVFAFTHVEFMGRIGEITGKKASSYHNVLSIFRY